MTKHNDMDDFNLERALTDWRKRVIAEQAPEAEDLAELESGLQDRYDEFLIKGLSPTEAFREAAQRVMPSGVGGGRKVASGFGWSLLGNYFKVAGRNLGLRRWYNLTNYVSLTLGIVTAALALLYFNYETSYDAYLPRADQKYRVGMNLRSQGYSLVSFSNFNATESAAQLRQIEGISAVPGVRRAVQFATFPEPVRAEMNARELPLENTLETNTPATFLAYFDLTSLLGDPATFQEGLNAALLTESEAIRFFGPEWRAKELIGEILRIDTVGYTVAGVVEDMPANAHFTFSVALYTPQINYWGARIYVELDDGTDPDLIKRGINDNFGAINTSLATDELFGGVLLQPITSLHLGSDLLYELKPPGDVRYLYIIGLIAMIILLLTISNYTNLSIVMNGGRAREIGMRKIFGASEGQIAGQFLLEAVLLALLTLPLVLFGLWWIIPRFNVLMGVELSRSLFSDLVLPGQLIALTLGVGLLAGGYPALFLARTRVQGLFKGGLMNSSGARIPTRSIILTLQFMLLIGLCSLTLFVNRQLTYIQAKDLGYNTEGILYVNLNADSSRYATFRNEMLRLPEVTAVGSGSPMGQSPFNQTTYKLSGTDQVFDDANNVYLDYRAIAQLGIETSVPDYVADPAAAPPRLVLVNETLANRLKNRFGLTGAELPGKTLIQEPEYVNEETGEVGFPYVIGGTFTDVHMFSLREEIDPMFLTVYRDTRYAYWASLSYENTSRSDLLAKVESRYEELGFDQAFVHAFLADNLADLYVEEARIATLSNYFSLLAFVMAIIGLVVLTSYLTTLKRKEIGVRKILGASGFDILKRFNLEYLPMLAVATVLAVPLTWWGVSRWLGGFAYRIEVDVRIFLVAVLIVAIITSLAVSVVTLRAAAAIPARVLTSNE